MPELEKVIAGLESCRPGRNCGTCPYHELFDKGICNRRLEEDALAMLKAQMPRVMTFEEVYKFSCKAFDQYVEDSPLYVECRERYPYQLKWLTVDGAHEWMRDDETMERRKLTYNNAKERWGWRCWTSRPSPEQMANTPWEGEKDA